MNLQELLKESEHYKKIQEQLTIDRQNYGHYVSNEVNLHMNSVDLCKDFFVENSQCVLKEMSISQLYILKGHINAIIHNKK